MLKDIYQLVHVLNKAEKRYFQRYSTHHTLGEKNSYLKLFEALNGQKEFNEQEIQAAFKAQNLYLLKRHLYRSILRSTRSFHEVSSVAIRINSMISEAELLYKKGLTKEALKLIHHAKKTVGTHELHLSMVQLLELEVKLLSTGRQLAQSLQKISQAFDESEKQLQLHTNYQRCFRFRMNVSAIHNKEILFRLKEDRDKYGEEIKELLTKDLSEKAKWELYSGAGTYFSGIGNHARGLAYHKKAAAISKKRAFLVSSELRQYLLSLYTQSIASFYLKRYEEALSNLKNLRSVFSAQSDPTGRKNIEELYIHSLLLEGFIHMDTHSYDQAGPILSLLKKETENNKKLNVSLRNDIYYQQTGFWFSTGDFNEAKTWVSRILQDEEAPKENPARYRFARLMQLVVLLELKEFDQISDLLPATKKFLKRKGMNFKVEEILLAFISQYVRDKEFHNAKYRTEKFSKLSKKLSRTAKEKSEAASLRIFDYIAWAKARAENKTMAELLK